jgi:primosomal protein N' (replication factor Y)
VVKELVEAAEAGDSTPFLLHGITGSGKTRVYIELLKAVRARGRGGIVLVPEISLTPQTVKRFRAHFGDEVAVLHSGLSDGERYDAWRQLRSGEKRIAVGARSALFAPVRDLGVIVVDEEHDGSYKQSEAPRYQARDLAVMRARMTGGVCLLGSATPSLESWANASKGKFRLLRLPDRVAGGALPPVELLDLRQVRKEEKKARRERRSQVEGGGGAGVGVSGARGAGGGGGGGSGPAGTGPGGTILAPALVEAVASRLRKEEQVILLLNRRGYAAFVQCRECGDVRRCQHCAVSLTYHRASGRLICHHCRYEEPAPKRCPECGSEDLDHRGLGTEQVERVVLETFPSARVARMDVDTTSGKWAHQEILGRVERGEVDILLGTQMIAKGLDFPRVTLVGVVNADVGIHLPDFRAGERTFQLLSQVAGRAGRGPLGGKVLIQTSMPDHYVLQAVRAHDYEGFAQRELEERLNPPYPPHLRMVNVVVSSPQDQVALENAEAGVRWVDEWIRAHPRSGIQRVGPAPAPIERLHGRYRWHFLLRGGSPSSLGALCTAFMGGFQPRGADVRVALDRDPVALL